MATAGIIIGILALNALSWWALIYFKLTVFILLGFILFIMSLMAILFIFNKSKLKYFAGIIFTLLVFLCGNLFADYYSHKAQLWKFFITDPQLGWKAGAGLQNVTLEGIKKTYVVSTNHMGFRGKWPENHEVVNVIQGDSNVFGFGLDEPETLASQLSRKGNRLCVNLGINGYDLHQYILQYEQIKPKLQVKHRIIIMSLGNDYACSTLIAPYYYPRPYLYSEKESEPLRVIQPQVPLALQEYGLHFIPSLSRYDDLLSRYGKGHDFLDGISIPGYLLKIPLAKWTLERMMRGPSGRALFRMLLGGPKAKAATDHAIDMAPWYGCWCFLPTDLWPSPYREFRANFSQLLAKMRGQGEETVLVILPMRQQVNPVDHAAALEKMRKSGYSLDQIDFLTLNQEIMNRCGQIGLPCLDLTPYLKLYPHPDELFQPQDQHLTAKGTELASNAILTFLEKLGKNGKNPSGEN
jgi:hypothetical protein